MKRALWGLAFALAALAMTGTMSGCGPGGGAAPATAAKDTFTYPINTNPTTFDPALVQDGDTIDLLQNVYIGLVAWDVSNEPVGALAEKWEVGADQKTYTFTLRENAKFHNGRQVTAEDIKWSIERACNPKLASPTAGAYLNDIVGVDEALKGTEKGVRGVTVVDPRTVKIELKQPTPYFLGKLTYLVSAPVAKEAAPADSAIIEVTQMIGTGPFKIESTVRDQVTTLAAFADYFEGAPKLAKIVRPVVKDPFTVTAKYRNDEVDLVRLQRQDVAGIQKDSALKDQLKTFDRPAIWYIGMNQVAYPPFKDRRVRRAFAMAIDREAIVNQRMAGLNKVAKGILPPGVLGHREEAAYIPFDPAEAKKLLAEAGFPGGKGLPPLEMYFREQFADIKLVAEAAAGMLKENLGVEVKLQSLEWSAYLDKFNKKELPFYHMRWAADYLDPQNFLSNMLATWGPENKLGYNSPEFDKLCREADSLLDWDKRKPLYEKAEDIALQDAPWIPIYFQRDVELHKPRLGGLRSSAFGHLPHTTTTVSN